MSQCKQTNHYWCFLFIFSHQTWHTAWVFSRSENLLDPITSRQDWAEDKAKCCIFLQGSFSQWCRILIITIGALSVNFYEHNHIFPRVYGFVSIMFWFRIIIVVFLFQKITLGFSFILYRWLHSMFFLYTPSTTESVRARKHTHAHI